MDNKIYPFKKLTSFKITIRVVRGVRLVDIIRRYLLINVRNGLFYVRYENRYTPVSVYLKNGDNKYIINLKEDKE